MILAYAVGIIILIAFTALAFWTRQPVLFMVTAGIALMCGLYSPDALGALSYSEFGVSIGLMLILYCFTCAGFAYGNLLKGSGDND